jgi:hypothetical protein
VRKRSPKILALDRVQHSAAVIFAWFYADDAMAVTLKFEGSFCSIVDSASFNF